MIYFMCPRPAAPSGGVWFLHRLAQLLQAAGQPARVVPLGDFSVWWDAHLSYENLSEPNPQLLPGDTLVVPEVLWPQAARQGVRTVLFVQNYIWLDKAAYFSNPAEVVVCSQFLANYMGRIFGRKVTGVITPFLDDDVWAAGEKLPGRVVILARRNPHHADLREKLTGLGFDVDYITEPLDQRTLAAHLARAEYYAHLTYPEGFPIAVLEAYRSRAAVVGTTGGGGNEFMFDRQTARVVQDPENGRYWSDDEFVARLCDQFILLRADESGRAAQVEHAYAWSLRYTAAATLETLKGILL